MRLDGVRVLLGVTAGIAAYKTPSLVRLLVTEGADVRVCMTANAHQFVTPMSLQAVSGQPVVTNQCTPMEDDAMDHISLARWADVILIVPATAHSIARFALGMADDLLSCICLASQSLKCLVPAMNKGMWQQLQVQRNIGSLRDDGWHVFPVATGVQACGEYGEGRMIEVDDIVTLVIEAFGKSTAVHSVITGSKILITAGPTQEAIDPVRYITNHSSGKMGYALARAALQAGAEVRLVSGPVNLTPPAGVELVQVISAEQMLRAVMQWQHQCDIFIACAAVADYRMKYTANQKIKKSDQEFTLKLEKTPDILGTFTNNKEKHQFVVGFAAETENLLDNAQDKLIKKNLDMIVANQVGSEGNGFYVDYNRVVVLTNTLVEHLDTMSKLTLAKEILRLIGEQITGGQHR